MTSELQNQDWAVLSERGCEATELIHEDARRMVHRLEGEGRHGLCIVTAQAARGVQLVADARDLRGERVS